MAEEDEFDRRALWRLGSWGVGAVGAVIVAVMANQSSLGLQRDQVAAADLARQAQQIQLVAKESQNEARRLASAIDTLNGDRDRLYSRVTVPGTGAGFRHRRDRPARLRQRAIVAPPAAASRRRPQHRRQPSRRSRPPPAPARRLPTNPAAATAEPGPRAATPPAKDAAKTDTAKAEAPGCEAAKPTLRQS